MMHPDIRIITRVVKPCLVLTGVRDLTTLQELEPDQIGSEHGWEVPRKFDISSLDQAESAAQVLNPGIQEGFVVVDAEFRRMKVKSPTYVALSLLGCNITKNFDDRTVCKFINVLKRAETSEFIAHFPKLEKAYRLVEVCFVDMMKRVENGRGILGKKFQRDSGDIYDFVQSIDNKLVLDDMKYSNGWQNVENLYRNTGALALQEKQESRKLI